MTFIDLLAQSEPQSPLAQVLNSKTDEELSKKLDELSLWRDAQLDPLTESEKKAQLIRQTLTPFLQSKLQRALKDPAVSQDLKQKLLEARKSI